MGMSGLGLALGALSQGIADTSKGVFESEEELRKLAEDRRRQAAEMRAATAFPEEIKGLQLRNRATQQQIDQSTELHPLAVEGARIGNKAAQQSVDITGQKHGWEVADRPTNAALLRHQEQQARVLAENAAKNAEVDYNQKKAQVALLEEELRIAKIKSPYAAEEIELGLRKARTDAEIAEQTLKKSKFEHGELEKAAQMRTEAGIALYNAWKSGQGIDGFKGVAAKYGNYLDPNHPLYRLIEKELDIEAQQKGLVNPMAQHREARIGATAARNDAQQEADHSTRSALGELAFKRGGTTVQAARDWFVQYHYSQKLQTYENPRLGIVYSPEEKRVGPMPPQLLVALADDRRSLERSLGWTVDQPTALRIYSRMNQYVSHNPGNPQIMDWNTALRLASQDEMASRSNKPTPSDAWVKDIKTPPGILERLGLKNQGTAPVDTPRPQPANAASPGINDPPPIQSYGDRQAALEALAQKEFGLSLSQIRDAKRPDVIKWLNETYDEQQAAKK